MINVGDFFVSPANLCQFLSDLVVVWEAVAGPTTVWQVCGYL